MARAAINAVVLSTPSPVGLPLVKRLATDSKTWKKGELCYITSGAVLPLSTTTGGALVYGIFAEDQATSTSSTNVWVRLLTTGTRLLMSVTNNGTDAAVSAVAIGTEYAAYNVSNICYLDSNVTTNGQFKVVAKLDATDVSDTMPERTTYDGQSTAGTPGLVEVEFTAN
jgi:hypothetical protein